MASPKVMGIINVTPDSFYAGSRASETSEVVKKAVQMKEEGASFIDIGGYSSRPGGIDISEDEEINRIVPVIEAIRDEIPELFISADTFRSSVAKAAIKAGADIINDISGGSLDEKMFDTVAHLGTPYIMMHMKGTPQTMKQLASYNDITLELIEFFQKKVAILKEKGVSDLILDPGFGFAKTIDQNFELISQLNAFSCLELPLLCGISRKSMIYNTLDISPEEALNGTTMLHGLLLENGCNILRVHDVKEAIECVRLWNRLEKNRIN